MPFWGKIFKFRAEMLNFYNNDPLVSYVQFKVLMNDLALLLDLFGNSEETKLLICTVIYLFGVYSVSKMEG